MWQQPISHVVDGEAVRASVAGRPDRDLERRTDILLARLDALSAGTALHRFDAPISSDVVLGAAVYWNVDTGKFEPALAASTVDADTGYLVLSPTAVVVGICDKKTSSSVGDILLMGLSTVDFSAATTETPSAGRYFLSSVTPGQLTQQQPGISIPVLYASDETTVYVQPLPSEFLLSHVHFGIELHAVPAGDTNSPDIGDDHAITVADSSAVGWLPADDAIFEGLAPAGAKYGYNLSQHTEVRRLWPPVPLTNAALAVERPKALSSVLDPIIGETVMSDEFVKLDANGIWWMSTCWNQAPWPYNYSAGGDSSSATVPDTCGPTQTMRMKLYFGKMGFANDQHVVTSLRSESSELTVLNNAGLAAGTGDLVLTLDLSLAVDNTTAEGGNVLKQITDNKFVAGNVLEGLIAGTNNVVISSATKRRQIAGDNTSPWVYQGISTISLDTEPGGRELAPEIIKLGDAKERTHSASGIPYIGLTAGRVSRVQLIFQIPAAGLPTSPTLQIRGLLLGTASGTLPALTVTKVVTARPENALTPVAMPDDTDIAALGFDATEAITAGSYIEIASDAFNVVAGDTVYVTIERSSGDGYSGEVGILRINGILAAG